jgi:hypothetical protein
VKARAARVPCSEGPSSAEDQKRVMAIDKTPIGGNGLEPEHQHHNHEYTYRRTRLTTSGGGRRGCISHAEAIRGFAGLHVSEGTEN